MASPRGSIDPAISEPLASQAGFDQPEIRESLKRDPARFGFFQAVRLLEKLSHDCRPVGQFVPPSTEAVRFGVNNSSSFPVSDIESLEWPDGKPAAMTVNFMGLTGPQGVMPGVYDELIERQERGGDETFRDFLDIFNHRIISLFYRAWRKHHFETAFETGEGDRLSQYLLDITGLGTPGLQARQRVFDESVLYYAGLLSAHPRSAAALQQLLADYFVVEVAIEQFAGRWRRLDPESQTCLNNGNTPGEELGYGVVVGDEIWDAQSGVRIKLGPLTLSRYIEFLPTGAAFEPLRALTRFYSGDELDFEVQLTLKRDDVRECQLGAETESGPRLGWVSWMKCAPFERDPGDTILQL